MLTEKRSRKATCSWDLELCSYFEISEQDSLFNATLMSFLVGLRYTRDQQGSILFGMFILKNLFNELILTTTTNNKRMDFLFLIQTLKKIFNSLEPQTLQCLLMSF